MIIGIYSNEDGSAKDTVQKNHIPDLLFTSLCVSYGFYFLRLKLCEQKVIKCFSMKLNKYQELICCYVLAVLRTPKKSFHVLILATTPCRCLARCIPTCRYCIYYCSLPSESSSSLLKVPNTLNKATALKCGL